MRVKVVLLLAALMMAAPRVEAFIALNEILADPATDLSGDANNDGVRDVSDDEFIELVNFGDASVNLSGWYLTDAISTRHVFEANTFLDPYSYLVVFGGSVPVLPGIDWQTASSGSLGLNNAGDTITLYDLNDQLIQQVVYDALAGSDQSIVRSPEASGSFVLHTAVVPDALFSPGEGGVQAPIGQSTVPEPATFVTFLGASLAMLRKFKTA